jgi:tRNA modification GTPase
MPHADTIVAVSTPIHAAIRAIIRMSGDRAFSLVDQLSIGERSPLAHACVADHKIQIAPGIAFDVTIYPFRSPRSSTGEDVIELHVPASPFLVVGVLKRLTELGARQAEPGEFTARAFFSGKLDLTAAEGVAAAISASNRAELDAARQLLGGELARRLTPILDELVSTLALLEVGIDFTEEDVTFIDPMELGARLDRVGESLSRLVTESPRIERLSHEPRIVLTGRPNAGKSTLLNALAGTTRAVVSDVAGTTRDALSARVALPRGFVTLVDVAGLEEPGGDSISQQMQSAARSQIETADAVVLLVDSTDHRPPVELPRGSRLIVYSKTDLAPPPPNVLGIDATRSAGFDRLRSELDAIAFGSNANGSDTLAINARHVRAIEAAVDAVKEARWAVGGRIELIASDLRVAIDQLGGVLGNVSPDDVLGRIFSSFCIGK